MKQIVIRDELRQAAAGGGSSLRSKRIIFLFGLLAVLLLAWAAVPARPAAAACGGTTNVANEAQLNAAITAFNAVNAGPCVFTIQLTSNIPLTATTAIIHNETANVSLVIEGDGFAVDGQGTSGVRVFYIFFNTYVTMNEITVKGGRINSNSDTAGGAGILLYGGDNGGGHLTLTNSTVTGNTIATTVGGGGIAVQQNSTLTVRNSTISGNSSTRTSGGISNQGSVTLDSVTITKNSAPDGGSGYATATGTLTIRNSIIAGNTGSVECRDLLGNVTDQGHNLVRSHNGCGFVNGVNGTIVGQAANLGPLANNGGPTQTHLPNAGSPAINAGDTTLAVDQRGIARPQGTADDIGAVEVAAGPTFDLTIVKEAVNDDGTFNFSFGVPLNDPLFPNFSLTTVGGTAQRTFTDLPIPAGGDIVLFETIPAGWKSASVACVGVTGNAWGTSLGASSRRLDITPSPDDNVICTFTNVKGMFDLTIVKETAGGDGTFGFRPQSTVGEIIPSFDLTTQAGTAQRTFTGLAAAVLTIEEDDIPDGWNLANIDCVGVTGDLWTPAGDSVVIEPAPGDQVTCTFLNERLGRIFIEKHDTSGLGIFEFSQDIDNSGNFFLADGVTQLFLDVVPGQYNVTELDPSGAGYQLGGLTCDDLGSTIDIPNRTATINLAAGQTVTCTFVNIEQAKLQDHILIMKLTDPADPSGNASFDFEVTKDAGLPQPLSLIHGELADATVDPGSVYTITELATNADYALKDIVCFGGGNPQFSGSSVTLTFGPAGDEAALCIFVNTELASLTVVKEALPPDGTEFPFEVYNEDTLIDDFSLQHAETNLIEGQLPGNFRVKELGVPGWDLTTVACELADGTPKDSFTVGLGEILVELEPGEDVTCTFTNAKQAATNFCPAGNPDVGLLMTDLLGTGMGNTKKGVKSRAITIPDYQDVDSLYGQLAAVEVGMMKYVRFRYPDKTYVQIHAPTSPALHSYMVDWWGSDLTPSSNIRGQFFWGPKGNKAPRAFVLWPTYNTTEEYANVFRTFDDSATNHVFWDDSAGAVYQWFPEQTQILSIPETQADGAQILVKVALVDNDKDNRPVILTVSAGGVVVERVLFVPNAGDLLNLEEILLENVPAGTYEVVIHLLSPDPSTLYPSGGDSVAMIGAAASYACDVP